MLHVLSTVVLVLVTAGVMLRHRRAVHLRLMAAAFAIDLALVLYIEITRHAVERVAGETSPLIWFHATVSLIVLALYAGQITLGRRLLAGRVVPRRAHMVTGLAFCIFRSLNYATAFVVTPGAPPAIAQAGHTNPQLPSRAAVAASESQ